MIGWFRRAFVNNLGTKLASLILACMVYAHVYAQQIRVISRDVPLVVEGIPPHLTIEGEIPPKVQIRIRARGSELIKLRAARGPHAVIRLDDVREGRLQRPVTTADILFPPGVDARAEEIVNPVSLSLMLQPLRRRTLPVAVSTTGRPPEGMVRYGRVRVSPETLTVWGPAAQVAGLDSLRTEEVALGSRMRGEGEDVRLRLPAGVRSRLEQVVVQVPLVHRVTQDLGTLRVGLPAAYRGRWTVSPESVAVTIAGPEPVLQGAGHLDLEVRANLPDPPQDGDQVPVEVELPTTMRGVISVDAIEPPTVALWRIAP